MKDTALLALSSPEGSDNYYSRLINLKDDNDYSFFRIIDCFMVCESCRKLERDKQILCDHVKQTAFWLSSRKTKRLKALYKTDPGTALRELTGMIVDDFTPCFRREDIEELFNLKPILTKYSPKHVYVAVDPNGGGPSQMAIVSGYFDSDTRFVVSLFILVDPLCTLLMLVL